MNTSNPQIVPLLKSKGRENYVFALEDYELAFEVKQMDDIVKAWESGADIELIAKQQKRMVEEVFLALFDQALKEKVKRPFAWRMS